MAAATLIALTIAGAVVQWRYNDATIGWYALAQMPFYGTAVWASVMRPEAFDSKRAVASILVVAAIMRVLVIAAPPVSSDIYRYVWDGRVQAAAINPYRYVPADEALRSLRDTAIFPSINRAEYAPTIYPPAAQMFFLVVTRISESLIVMKAALVLFEALAAWAIMTLLSDRGIPAARIVIYAWHPLPLWEFAGDGHIDIAAIALLLLACIAVERHRPILGGLALAAGVLVKFFPLLAAPSLYRRWDWRMPAAFSTGIGLLYLPYIGVGSRVFGFLGGYVGEEGFADGSGVFLWSLAASLISFPAGASKLYLPLVAATLFVMGLALFVRQNARADLFAVTVLLFAALVLLSPHYPWYFTWLVPFLCFYPFAAGLYLTGAAPVLHFANWPPTLAEGAVIYGGAIIVLLVEVASHWYVSEVRRGHANAE
jgi:hypothetical protein